MAPPTPPPLRLTPSSALWPEELRAVDPPPVELWLAGREELLGARPRVAVVGTRTPSPYGEAQARRFARALAEHGVTVVSGLARGIDQEAHEAALDAAGATVAVLGSGVDRPWPAGPTARRVAADGVLVSEFPLGQPPRRHHFPLRNRLISGLADAVVVIEAAYGSGSLITARWAADQGRSVFAVPGRVDHPMARGCHRLIREGAFLAERPGEVLAEIGLATDSADAGGEESAGVPAGSGEEARVLAALRGETLTVDELHRRLALPLSRLFAVLVTLELAERVVRGPGGLYRLPA